MPWLKSYFVISAAFLKDKGPWIVKPVASSRGRGVFLVNHVCMITSYSSYSMINHEEENECIIKLGKNCIQHFHLKRYMWSYLHRAIKDDLQSYIQRYVSHFEYGYPLSNEFLHLFPVKKSCFISIRSIESHIKLHVIQ